MALTISQKYMLAQRFRNIAASLLDTISMIDELERDYLRATAEMQVEAAKIIAPAQVVEGRAALQTMRDNILAKVRDYAGDAVWPERVES